VREHADQHHGDEPEHGVEREHRGGVATRQHAVGEATEQREHREERRSGLGDVVRHVGRHRPRVAVADDVHVPQAVPRREHVEHRPNGAASRGGAVDDVRVGERQLTLDRQVGVDA
jgi:hypothetical protein